MDKLSLYNLNKHIQEGIKNAFQNTYWVIAEMAQVKENYSGHCYVELIEKDKTGTKIIAQSRANIWAYTYRMLKPYFESATGQKFIEGLKVLIQVKVDYHELYGLSLTITDIEPEYTVGDLALKKAQIIKRLKDEGVFDINKSIELNIAPQRIAIISSETAAGYADFIEHLHNNAYNYRFETTLYNAFMQGEKTEPSIIDALEQINNNCNAYDLVVIIRGGGSQSDLSWFDSYWLAYNVAQFPLPIITGIGHEQDTSITDMVAHTNLKTPTAVANFLIDRLCNFETTLIHYGNDFVQLVNEIISNYLTEIEHYASLLPVIGKKNISNQTQKLVQLGNLLNIRISKHNNNEQKYLIGIQNKVNYLSKNCISKQFNIINKTTSTLKTGIKLQFMKQSLLFDKYSAIAQQANPENILQKGFSYTTFNGKIVKNASMLSQNDIIETKFNEGSISSKVVNN